MIMIQPFYISKNLNIMIRNFTLSLLLIILSVCGIYAQTAISITEARETDADGVLTRLDDQVILEGKAIGPNFRPGGQTFLLYSLQDGMGITVFSIDMDFGYSVTDYDNLRVTGTLAQFNGLAEIIPSSIEVLPAGGFNPTIGIVTTLDESTESKVVVYKDAMLVDPTQWATSGSFNVDMTNGTSTIQVRIDSDTDIAGMEAPTGTFDITGIGGQYDQDAPFDSGYQLFPRSIMDINPYNTGGGSGSDFKVVTMPEIRSNDADGVPELLGDMVEVTAVVYGVNMRPDGLQFTIIDDDNVGVGIFSAAEQLGYTVNEGDLIKVQGELGFFNGLTQITPSSIALVSTDNTLVEPRLITKLDESTESSLVRFFPQDVEDATQWLGNGTNFNVNFLNEFGDIVTVRIDADTYHANETYPGDLGTIYTGIGGQFDNTAPHDEGYQMLPRYKDDVILYLSNEEVYQGDISLFPNPISAEVWVEADGQVLGLSLLNLNGQLIKTESSNSMNVSDVVSGMYLLKVSFEKQYFIQKVVVR